MNSNPHYVLSKWAFNKLCATQVDPDCRLDRHTNGISKGGHSLEGLGTGKGQRESGQERGVLMGLSLRP